MGIKDFNKNNKQEYPDAFRDQWLSSYDYTYIDLNFALHHCSYEVKTKQDIYFRLFKFIENTLLEINPKKKVYFTSDGSAPLAKLLLQRARRSLKAKSIENINDASSLLFTPGTEFMNSLKSDMSVYMKYLSNVFNIEVEFLEKDFDEAELKLKKKIMENIEEDKTGNLTHLFVSNDADVILMLTTLENYKNVYICDRKACHILSIYKLMDLHTTKVGLTENAGLDYTALNLLLGNDYLPKVDYLDFNKVWNAYSKISLNNPSGLILKINGNIQFNTSFYLKLLSVLVVDMKSCYLNKPKQKDLMSNMYKNYYDGFAWCMLTYYNGICNRYNYMYGYESKPHPVGLMFHLNLMNKSLEINNMLISNPLPSQLYLILLLPKSQKHLVDKKYYQFMEQEKSLYIEEYCEKCKYFNKRILELEQNLPKTCDECNQIKKTMSLHKKQHQILALDDIDDIYNRFIQYS